MGYKRRREDTAPVRTAMNIGKHEAGKRGGISETDVNRDSLSATERDTARVLRKDDVRARKVELDFFSERTQYEFVASTGGSERGRERVHRMAQRP